MSAISEHVVGTARELEDSLVGSAARGTPVLTATGRLARRLLYRHRRARIEAGDRGWEGPPILSFRGWVSRLHDTLWSGSRPLSKAASLALWHEASRGIEPPAGLTVAPAVYRNLQEALDALLGQGLPPCPPASGLPLPDWRRAVTARFLRIAERRGFRSWPAVLGAAGRAVEDGTLALPEQIILAAFDGAAPVERQFLALLAERTRVSLWRAQAAPPPDLRVRVFGTPEQECRAVCAEVLAEWNAGRKDLGVVFADRESFPVLKRCFDELAGEGPKPDLEREVRYNLAQGGPLAGHPLGVAALLPLRIAVETEFRPLLAALLASPYVRTGLERWDVLVRECLWGMDAPLELRATLRRMASRGLPVQPLSRLAAAPPQPLRRWIGDLRSCWEGLGFFRLEAARRETDAIALRHVEDVLRELEREAGAVEVSAAGALAWCLAGTAGVRVSEPTGETAGIQVLGLAEAPGLAFERLWVVGVHGEALPQRPAENPFLDPAERRAVEGGTAENRWDSAKRRLAELMAAGPQVSLSRAAGAGDEAPLLPCPLVEDETDDEGRVRPRPVDLWKETPGPWWRATWLRQGAQGAAERGEAAVEEDSSPATPIRGEWAVTRLARLAACPFQFFAAEALRLDPLEAPESGIDPRERGGVIHRVLERFVNGLPAHAPGWPDDGGAAEAWLAEAVDSELGARLDNLFWQVERVRLLGEEGFEGVLAAWLAQERERARDGWRFRASEVGFSGLPLAGIRLKGRVDRVDDDGRGGLAVWDYKSGRAPSPRQVLADAVEIQLPAYVMALKAGLLEGLPGEGEHVEAGFIPLRTASEVVVRPLREGKGPGARGVDWDARLGDVRRALEERLAMPSRGLYPADPKPAPRYGFARRNGACEYCEYFNLCGLFDGDRAADLPEDPAGQEDEP